MIYQIIMRISVYLSIKLKLANEALENNLWAIIFIWFNAAFFVFKNGHGS